jgi:hypothetical protein
MRNSKPYPLAFKVFAHARKMSAVPNGGEPRRPGGGRLSAELDLLPRLLVAMAAD